MNTHLTRKLLSLTGGFIIAGAISYSTTRLFTPLLFPYWGRTLLILLFLWAAISVWLLLEKTSRGLALSLLTVLVILGYSLPWGGLAGLLLIVLAIALLLLTTLSILILSWFREVHSPRGLLLGFLPLLLGTMLLGSINLHPAPSATSTQSLSSKDELRYLYELDQRDRYTGLFILDTTRDQARLQRVLTLDQQQQIITPDAQYHAAMLLQHGTRPQHFQRAYELAEAAAQAHIPHAQALAHASYDRWMLSIDQPQKYHTQWLINQ